MILDPNLLKLLQSGGFYKNTAPIDPELIRRGEEQRQMFGRGAPVPSPAQPPAPAQNPAINQMRMEDVAQDVADALPSNYMKGPQPAPAMRQAPPKKEQGYFDKLMGDPTRMALLRYGMGVLGGEQPGTAIDGAMKMRAGMSGPGKAPSIIDLPLGNGKFVKAQWMGAGYQDPTIPGFPQGYKPIGSVADRWQPSETGTYETVQNPFGLGGVGQRGPGGKIHNYQKPTALKGPKDGDTREIKSGNQIITQMRDGDDWIDYTQSPQWNPDQKQSDSRTGSIKDYEYAKQNGYTGTFSDWVKTARQKDVEKVAKLKGWEKVDNIFAEEYANFYLGGGLADAQKGLSQLEDVYKQLTGGSDTLTGPMIGKVPDWIGSAVNPKAVALRETVEEVVQRNLRVILGAQFTEKEGMRLIARAYNPQLEESENAKRVRRLMKAIGNAIRMKERSARWFEEHGTMKGFKGTRNYTLADFENAVEGGGEDVLYYDRSTGSLHPDRRKR